MNQAEIDAQTQEVVIQKYELFKKGRITKETWATYLSNLLENYIKRRIAQNHRTIKAEFDDLMQSGRLAIMEKYLSYDPHLSAPSTFFTPYIDQNLRETQQNASGIGTSHYSAKAGVLDKVAKKHGFEGLMDKRLDDLTLSVISGVSLKTVIKTRESKQINVISVDDENNQNLATNYVYASPEDVCVRKERKKFLNDRLDTLDPLDRYILLSVEVDGKTYSRLQQELATDEARRLYPSLPEKAGQLFIQQRHNYAIQKLRQNPTLRNYVGIKGNTSLEIVEQASEADIDSAFAAGQLFEEL